MGIFDFLNTAKTGFKISDKDGVITLTGYTKKADVPGTLTIPETVQAIGTDALSSTEHVTKIIVPESVRSIGEHAFSFSQALEEVVLPNNPEALSDALGLFMDCLKLKTVQLPAGMNAIPSFFMSHCYDLEEFVIPEGVEEIEIGAFDSCEKLRYVRLPQSLKLIACGAFSHCTALESLTLPAGLEMIEVNAFEDCPRLKRLDIPQGCEVDEEAFGE